VERGSGVPGGAIGGIDSIELDARDPLGEGPGTSIFWGPPTFVNVYVVWMLSSLVPFVAVFVAEKTALMGLPACEVHRFRTTTSGLKRNPEVSIMAIRATSGAHELVVWKWFTSCPSWVSSPTS
jgi:hypothetical protein